MNNFSSNNSLPLDFLFSEAERGVIVGSFFLIFLAAFAGNLLILVLVRKDRQLCARVSPSHISLAIADLLASVFWLPFLVIDLYIVNAWIFGYAMCKIVVFAQFFSSASSTLNLCIVTCECFAAVWFPFFLKLLPRKKTILIASCLVVWLIAFVYGFVYAQYKIIRTYENGKDYCVEEFPNKITETTFHITNVSVISIGPLVTITVLNILCIYKLCTTSSHEPRIGNSKRNNFTRLATKKIITISMIFVICRLPVYLFNEISLYYDKYLLRSLGVKGYLATSTLCYGLYFFGAATHPLLFGLMSAQYKEAIKRNCLCYKSLPSLSRRRSSKSAQSSKVMETVF